MLSYAATYGSDYDSVFIRTHRRDCTAEEEEEEEGEEEVGVEEEEGEEEGDGEREHQLSLPAAAVGGNQATDALLLRTSRSDRQGASRR